MKYTNKFLYKGIPYWEVFYESGISYVLFVNFEQRKIINLCFPDLPLKIEKYEFHELFKLESKFDINTINQVSKYIEDIDSI